MRKRGDVYPTRLSARIRLGPTILVDLLQALAELAIARIRLPGAKARDLLRSPLPPVCGTRLVARADAAHRLIDRVAFAIPCMGARVPWRADCLVQAMAAQRWLSSRGVATSLVVGVRKPAAADFGAHAWLMAGGRVVTGGEVSPYKPIFQQSDD